MGIQGHGVLPLWPLNVLPLGLFLTAGAPRSLTNKRMEPVATHKACLLEMPSGSTLTVIASSPIAASTTVSTKGTKEASRGVVCGVGIRRVYRVETDRFGFVKTSMMTRVQRLRAAHAGDE
jgi:hypothetical protein